MGNNRRAFIKKITATSFLSVGSAAALQAKDDDDFFWEEAPEGTSNDENYWSRVRKQFDLSADCINLNSGNISPAPKLV